jgi:hypothetical protein
MNMQLDNDEGTLFVIERDLPGAGKLTSQQLKEIASKSCAVLDELGPSVQWMHSYVTNDRIYCIYSAPDETLIRCHGDRGGFPVSRVSHISAIIDPSTAGE